MSFAYFDANDTSLLNLTYLIFLSVDLEFSVNLMSAFLLGLIILNNVEGKSSLAI